MREIWLFLLLINGFYIVSLSSVTRVRLVDHTSYAISIIQKTMSRVEQLCWCNLKIKDMQVNLSEEVLGKVISAEIELKNGFVVSIQKIGIITHTIQQVWKPVSGNTTMVEVQSTVSMTDVAVGFDVITKMDGILRHSTGLIIYDSVEMLFTITKHLFTDEITVDVVGRLPITKNLMRFTPESDITKVFVRRFDSNSSATSVAKWAKDIFEPITLELATKEIEFPRICYFCSV